MRLTIPIPRFLYLEKMFSKSNFSLYFLTAKAVPTGRDIFWLGIIASVLSVVCFIANSNYLRTFFYLSVKLGLEELTQRFRLIYLDTNIFFEDHNKSREGDYPGLDNQIREAQSFAQIRQSDVDRHRARIHDLIAVCEQHSSIVTVDEILNEYEESQEMLDRTLRYLSERDGQQKHYGMRKQLRGICQSHRKLYELLQGRVVNLVSAEPLVRALLTLDLEKSKDGRFVKKNGRGRDQEIYQRDITLVANAIQAAVEKKDPIAVMSNDNDVINLVRNIGDRYRNNSPITSECSVKLQDSVFVYSPCRELWHPGLNVVFRADTETNVRLRYAARRRR